MNIFLFEKLFTRVKFFHNYNYKNVLNYKNNN